MASSICTAGEGRAVFDIEVFGAGQACRMDADLSLPPIALRKLEDHLWQRD
jgi:hypothetical protein